MSVEGGDWPSSDALHALAARVGEAVLVEVAHAGWPAEAALSLLFTDDARIAALNGDWRGKPRPTNVLSFPAADLAPGEAPGGEIGDVALAYGVVAREAAEAGLVLEDHLAHLLAHGLLHCLGYDHEGDPDAEAMERLEARALARLGLPDPYMGTERA